MRIACLGIKGLPSRGGAERVAEAIASRLAARHELTVYCDRRYTPAGVEVPGLRLVRIPSLPGKHLRPLSYHLLCALHALLWGNYDLVHVHNVEPCFALPLLRLRFPVVATAHGSPVRAARSKWGHLAHALMGLSECAFLWLSDRATSVSRADVEYYARRFRRQVLYLPNGVEEPAARSGAGRAALRELGLRPGRYLLFAAGRIEPTKGCHLVLEACRRADLRLPLVVVGDLEQVPEYGRELRRMAGERVRFVPFVGDKERLFAIVRGCRLFVLPSLVEGMSMMLLEVASLGVPLVCSDIPENVEVVGRDALYFRSGDAWHLARRLTWALGHPERMAALAARARARVRRRFAWEGIVPRYELLYQECQRSARAQEPAPGHPAEGCGILSCTRISAQGRMGQAQPPAPRR